MTLLRTQHQGKNELRSLYHSKGQAASEILVLTRIIISKSCADAKESRRNPYCLRKAFRSTLLSPLTEIRSSCRFFCHLEEIDFWYPTAFSRHKRKAAIKVICQRLFPGNKSDFREQA